MGWLKKSEHTKVQGIQKKEKKKEEMWTHEGPMCFKGKLAHVQRNKERNSS